MTSRNVACVHPEACILFTWLYPKNKSKDEIYVRCQSRAKVYFLNTAHLDSRLFVQTNAPSYTRYRLLFIPDCLNPIRYENIGSYTAPLRLFPRLVPGTHYILQSSFWQLIASTYMKKDGFVCIKLATVYTSIFIMQLNLNAAMLF